MCGIAGFLDLSLSSPADALQGTLTRMVAAVRHRGPDAEGQWTDPAAGLAFGHTRLSIQDLSETGAQPMHSADGRFVIVYNGELYNAPGLKAELEAAGCAFRGHSDTEVLLEACARWGLKETIKRINGMFAFALWDRRERRLSLVRDAAGIKPLYWAEAGACVLFGSELKPLRCHPDFDATIDRDAVFSLLRHNYVKGPRTIHAGARKLAPGEVLEIEASGTRRSWRFRESWQSVRPDPAAGSGDPDALLDELEAVLADAVKRQMISDVPIGCFLSGGIDSSLMAALMQRQANAPVSTFTIGFHEPGFDEAEHAKAIAAHLGTRHTELYVDPVHCRETIPDLPGIYDEPFADMSQIPTLLLSRMTRRDVTVAISGDGGDEGFAGYARYQWALRFRRLRDRLGPGLSRTAAALMHAAPVPAWNALTGWRQPGPRLGERLHKIGYLLAGETPCRLYDHLLAQWDEPQGTALGGQDYDGYVTAARIHGEISDYQAFMQASDMAGYLPDDILTKVDRASMSVGLEARVPLLDDEVLAFLSRLPAGLCVAEGRGKVALRRLLCRHVPRELVDRPKHGFSVPMGAWLRGELRDWAEDLLSERRLREDGLLDPGAIRRLWRQHLAGQANYQYQLWGPLMLQAWLREQRIP